MKRYFKWAISLLSVTWMGAMLCFRPPTPQYPPYPSPPSQSPPPEPRRPSRRVKPSEHIIDLEKAFLADLQNRGRLQHKESIDG